MTMIRTECPLCSGDVRLQVNHRIGDQVECSSCRMKLEVIWSDPMTMLSTDGENEDFPELFHQW